MLVPLVNSDNNELICIQHSKQVTIHTIDL